MMIFDAFWNDNSLAVKFEAHFVFEGPVLGSPKSRTLELKRNSQCTKPVYIYIYNSSVVHRSFQVIREFHGSNLRLKTLSKF